MKQEIKIESEENSKQKIKQNKSEGVSNGAKWNLSKGTKNEAGARLKYFDHFKIILCFSFVNFNKIFFYIQSLDLIFALSTKSSCRIDI